MGTVGKRPDRGAFIPAILDDYPLKPAEFRIYAHIMRRAGTHQGKHYESIPNTAKHCGMNQKTARNAIHVLQALRMIIVTEHPGWPSDIEPTHEDDWAPPEMVAEIREATIKTPPKSGRTPLPKQGGVKNGTPSKSGRGTPPKSGRTPLPKEDHKGTPVRYSQEGTDPDQFSLNHSLSDPEGESEKPIRKNPTAVEQSESRFTAQRLPKWRTGTGPNDWNDAAVDAVLGWLNEIRRAKREPDAKRADAIAYIARREYPGHSDYPALVARIDELLAAKEENPARRWRQRLREEKLAKASHET